jgi:hypothetical protein
MKFLSQEEVAVVTGEPGANRLIVKIFISKLK